MVMDIFATKIHKVKFPNIELLYRLCKDFVPNLNTNEDFWALNGTNTTFGNRQTIHNKFQLRELVSFVESESEKYWNELGLYNNVRPIIHQSWINVSKKDDSVLSHMHGNFPMAAVVYLAKEKGSGDIILEHPLDVILGCQPLNDFNKTTKYKIETETGDVLLFPGYIRHYTLPNTSDSERIVFVCNLGIDRN